MQEHNENNKAAHRHLTWYLVLIVTLLLAYVAIGNMFIYGFLDEYPIFERSMLIIPVIHAGLGTILERLNNYRLSAIEGVIAFILLCILLYYSYHWYSILVFFPSIYTVLMHRIIRYDRYMSYLGEDANEDNLASKLIKII